jgi:anaerobic ribonucleoside-triphosphate reductase
MEVIFNTLGKAVNISVVDRTNEKVVIRGREYNRNFPLYCIRYYDKTGESKGTQYKWFNNSLFFKIKEIKNCSNDEGKAYCVNIKNDAPYFTLANGIVTHNCRMVSSQEMMELGAEANSFGGGGVGKIGSHRVITIDFFRIAKRVNTLPEYIKELKKQLEDSTKILKAHKDMITDLQAKGKHPFIDRGYIDMNRMFSTFGIMGIVEGADVAEERFNVTRDEFLRNTLETVHSESFSLAKQYKLIINVEQVPGESLSHRMPKANRILLGEEECTYPLFANQFIPMWEDATLWDRMEVDGKYGSLFTGGGIVHFSLGERTLPKQNEKIIRHAVKTGCEHFSLNPVYSVCEDCGDTKFAKLTICGSCGSDNIEYYTRTVGFFTPVKAGWSKPKQEHDFAKREFKSVE